MGAVRPVQPLSPDPAAPPWPRWTTILVSPLLYAMIIPLVLLDLSLELYHRLVFPVIGLPAVPRRSYIRVDRHRLPYLSPVLKLACAYCGYANGVIQYAARIAGDTERYFCPIKHRPSKDFQGPPHHAGFAEYGDEAGWRQRWK
jgi:hypothetical protein